MTSIVPSQLLQQLQWRYATKQFDPTCSIPPDAWTALEQSLVLAPSSYGLQPWQFLVVRNPDLRRELRAASWNQSQVVDASHFVVLAVRTQIDQAFVQSFMARIAEVRGLQPEALAGYRRVIENNVLSLDEHARRNWASRQVYLALGSLLASAAMLGIDACPLEGLDQIAYDRILNLESRGLNTVVACALGYRAATDSYADLPKVRFPQEKVVQNL